MNVRNGQDSEFFLQPTTSLEPSQAIPTQANSCFFKKKKKFFLIGQRDVNVLFHLFMHSLADSCVCPDWGSNPQPWCIGDDAPTNWATQAGSDSIFWVLTCSYYSLGSSLFCLNCLALLLNHSCKLLRKLALQLNRWCSTIVPPPPTCLMFAEWIMPFGQLDFKLLEDRVPLYIFVPSAVLRILGS